MKAVGRKKIASVEMNCHGTNMHDHIKALIGTELFGGEEALLENIKILF